MKRQIATSLLALSLLAPNVVSAQGHDKFIESVNDNIIVQHRENNYLKNIDEEKEVNLIVILKDNSENLNFQDLKTESGKSKRLSETKKIIDEFKEELVKENIKYSINYEYDYLLCGLAIKTQVKNVEKISKLNLVDYVQQSIEYKMDTKLDKNEYAFRSRRSIDSNRLIGIQKDRNSHLGEGMVVAVLDSGLDVDHPILRVSHPEKGKYKNAEEVKAEMVNRNINYGEWKNNKVVYAYNYFKKNNDVKEPALESHGMHVSGISVGNPAEEQEFKNPATGETSKELIVGVAPEAQLIFMNVFDNNMGTTSSQEYAKAIEDSVKLGADSINMSLGSPNGTLASVDRTTIEAINNAKAAGTVVAIAAGNDGWFGTGYSKPTADNPDYGTLGTPSVAEDSLSVASINTTIERANAIEVNGIIEKIKSSSIYLGSGGQSFNTDDEEKTYEFVDAGLGKDEDFANKNFEGKVALIQRGEITFAQKILNAQKAKAVGVILYNHETGGNEIAGMDLGELKAQIQIPSVFIGHDDGERIKQVADKKFKALNGLIAVTSPIGATMSDFSSYGISTDGEFKPDITAPGGNIYSSINDGHYTSMNGTSMATPHVAGAIPILRQSLKERHPEITGADEYNIIKAILMSTAVPVKEAPFNGDVASLSKINLDNDLLVSPRKQGAGLINVDKALHSELYLTDENDRPNIWLGNTDGNLNIKVKIHNIGNKAKTLKYDTVLQTDEVKDNRFALKARKLDVVYGQKVTVEPGSSKLIEVTIDASKHDAELSKLMKNGYFLEGFVIFKDAVDNVDAVSIPYSSFKGNWGLAPIFEKSIYDFDEKTEQPMYAKIEDLKADKAGDVTALISKENNEEIILGYDSKANKFDKTKIAFSPNGDGVKDFVQFRGVFFRNADDLRIHIEKKDDPKVVRDLNPFWGSYYMKNSDAQRPGADLSNLISFSSWNAARVYYSLPEYNEGVYKYTVFGKSVVKGAPEQKVEFEITLDKTKPVVKEGKLEGNLYTPEVEDNLSGVEKVIVKYGEGKEEDLKEIQPNEAGKYELPEGATLDKVLVRATDYAGNSSTNKEDSKKEEVKKQTAAITFYGEDGDMLSFVPSGIKVKLINREDPSKTYEARNNITEETFTVDVEPGVYDVKIETPSGYYVAEDEIILLVTDGRAVKTVHLNRGEKPKKDAPKQKRKITIELDGMAAILPGLKVEFIDKENENNKIVAEEGASGNLEAELLEGKYTMKVTVPAGYEKVEDQDIFVGTENINKTIYLEKSVEEPTPPVTTPVVPEEPVEAPAPEVPAPVTEPEKPVVPEQPAPAKPEPVSPVIHLDPVVPAPKTENNDNERPTRKKHKAKKEVQEAKETKVTPVAQAQTNIVQQVEVKESKDKILQKPEKIVESKFVDVKNHWSSKAVDMVTTMGLYKGMDEKHFAPDTNISEGMFITLLNRLAKNPKAEGKVEVKALDEKAYYAEALKWAAEKKIVKLKDNKFAANEELTRAEVAEFLSKYVDVVGLKFNKTTNTVNDISKLNKEQQEAINKIVSLGIMQGKGNGKFDPAAKLTRAEIAQILINIINKAK